MKVALLVIYNHRYDKNISRINELYNGRFTYVFHIVPFYDGVEKKVIPVYESSFNFSGYIAQAYTHLKEKGFTHFFVVADDMVLNPVINEWNLWQEMGIGYDECYLDEFLVLQNHAVFWSHMIDALCYTPDKKGVEIMRIIPSVSDAKKSFEQYGIPYDGIPLRILRKGFLTILKGLFKRDGINMLRNIGKKSLSYPLVGGYSDIFLLTADVMDRFCLYCGAFAATDLFVELAVPTAIVLSVDKLKTSRNTLLQPGAMWSDKDKAFLEKYHYSLDELLKNYDKKKLYIHPVKLSQWK